MLNGGKGVFSFSQNYPFCTESPFLYLLWSAILYTVQVGKQAGGFEFFFERERYLFLSVLIFSGSGIVYSL